MLIATKISSYKTLLTISRKNKRQGRSQLYYIPKLTSTSTMIHPQNSHMHASNHMNIPLQSHYKHQPLLRRQIYLINPYQECADMTE